MQRDELERLARTTALAHQVDPVLFCALIEQESDWDEYATRFEKRFYERYTRPMSLSDTEEYLRAVSWGLTQVMGQVAREFGYKGRSLGGLLNPYANLDMGIRVLKAKLSAHGGDVHSGLLAYNGGGNLEYATHVIEKMAHYQPRMA